MHSCSSNRENIKSEYVVYLGKNIIVDISNDTFIKSISILRENYSELNVKKICTRILKYYHGMCLSELSDSITDRSAIQYKQYNIIHHCIYLLNDFDELHRFDVIKSHHTNPSLTIHYLGWKTIKDTIEKQFKKDETEKIIIIFNNLN